MLALNGQSRLVTYAAKVCQAPVAPPPSPAQVRSEALDRLLSETDITRQLLGRAIQAAPTTERPALKAFDVRLRALDCTAYAIGHPGGRCSEPGFPSEQTEPFQQTLDGLQGELPLLKQVLSAAEASTTSGDRELLKKQGAVVGDLTRKVARLKS